MPMSSPRSSRERSWSTSEGAQWSTKTRCCPRSATVESGSPHSTSSRPSRCPRTARYGASRIILVSPHTAALNAAEDRLIAELFAANATRFLDGDELVNKVDTVDFY